MSDSLTELEYDEEVESVAENIVDVIEEYPEDYKEDPWMAIHETIDRHEYVLNNYHLLDVLKHSESEPEEWQVYVADDETNHYEVLRAMAYTTFRTDVSRKVFDLAEERGLDL